MSSVAKLTEIMESSPQFTDSSVDDYIPLDKQQIYLKLAEKFQSQISHLYEDPNELCISTGVGSPELWEDFLNLEPVNLYILARTRNLTAIQARKSLNNLHNSAAKGDVSAIKYLNEISGVLQKQTDNKVVILTCVPRPTVRKPSEVIDIKEE